MSFNSATATIGEKRAKADSFEKAARELVEMQGANWVTETLLFDATRLRLSADREERELG